MSRTPDIQWDINRLDDGSVVTEEFGPLQPTSCSYSMGANDLVSLTIADSAEGTWTDEMYLSADGQLGLMLDFNADETVDDIGHSQLFLMKVAD